MEQEVRPISGSAGFWQDLRDSLAGSEQDFTSGSLGRALTVLAVPMVLEMLMQSVLGVVDVFFVSRLGAEAVAGVGITESLLTLVFALAMGASMATTAIVARRIGEGHSTAASRSTAQAIWLGILLSIGVALFGYYWSRETLLWMGATSEVVEVGLGYNTLMLAGNGTIVLLFLINAAFRGAGDAMIAMKVLWLANILNIILDPCLIFGLGPFPEMGVTGAAIATNASRGVAILYQVRLLFSTQSRLRIRFEHFRPDWPLIWNLVRVSTGGVLQFLVATASWLALVRIVAFFGSPALAGYTIAIRVIMFTLLPSWGLSNAAATLVGQNLGARKPDRAERSVWVTSVANMTFLGVVTVIFVTLALPISRLFTKDPEVLAYATDCLRYVSYGYIFYALGMVMIQSFNGAGDTYTPTVINFLCYWLLQIPLAYGLAVRSGMDAQGVFLAIAVSESVLAVVAWLVFRRGRWKLQEV